MRRIFWRMARLGALLCALVPAVVHAQTPSVKIGTAALLTPTDVDAYYATLPSTGTDSVVETTRRKEIVELARALNNDPDLIYDFVRNNISTEWAYGVRKGEVGALIDKSGTAFDQAKLMVELLRESGYSASYRIGSITLTGAQFASWSGITSAAAACQLLSSGGIPAIINGTTPPANCAFTGNVTSIEVGHVWVRVTIGGTLYVFDPAYKPYAERPGVDLATAAGLTGGQPLTQSQTGMETGTASSAPYVRNVGSEALNSTVQTYSTNLQTYIDANLPAGQLEDLIGWRDIVRYEPPAGGLRQANLPYTNFALRTYSGELPDKYRTSLQIQITKEQSGGGYATIVNKTLFVDEIYGRKLNFQTNNPTGETFTGALVLREDSGAIITLTDYTDQTNPGYANGTLTLTANLPYAASAGAYMDFSTQKEVTYALPLTIVHNWGDMGRGLMDKWGSRIDTVQPKQRYLYACDDCVSVFWESKGDGRREQVAASWPTQASRAAQIHAAIAKSIYTQHYAIGVVSADTEVRLELVDAELQEYRYNLMESYDVIDVESGISVTSRTADAIARRAVIHSIATTLEALEGSAFAQIADLPDTSSTATRFEWGNRPPTGEDAGSNGYGPRRFYEFNNATATAAANLVKTEGKLVGASDSTADGFHNKSTPELGRSEITSRRARLSGAISNYATAGYTVAVSEDGFLGPGQTAGAFYREVSSLPSGSAYEHYYTEQRGGALVATRYVGGEPVEIAHAIINPDGVAKGGGGGVQTYHQQQYDPAVAADVLKSRFVDRSNAVGVNLKDGSATYVSPAVISVGAGEFPYRLDAKLIWRGGNAVSSSFGPVDHVQPTAPWTTNWNNTLNVSSSALEAMGDTDIRATTGTLAAFLAMQDVYKASPTLQREVAGVLVGAWWVRQIGGNVATVSVGADTRQFLKRANGAWFAPGPGAVGGLTQTGSRVAFADPPCSATGGYTVTRGWSYDGVSFKVTGPNGDVQDFVHWKKSLNDATGWCSRQQGFRLTNWTWPQGVSVTLTYVSPTRTDLLDELDEVSNSLGRKIKFVASGLGGFNNGLSGADLRSVSFTSAGIVDAESNATKVTYGGFGGRYILKEIETPDAPGTASLRYVYDLNGRIKEAWDANALRLGSYPKHQFMIAEGVRSSRIDPQGGQYTVLYDADGRSFRFIDELGRTTSATYDGRGRVLSYTYPELDTETFAYDDRNNTTQLTKTAKPGSTLAPISISASWNATWNRPASITDARNYTTNFTYYSSGAGKSLMATATRPDPDGSGGPLTRPVYSFTYNTLGQPLTVTDPTNLVTQNVYNAQGYVASTAVDPTGVNAVTTFTYDAQGDVTTTDGPRTDVTDVSYALYDLMRRKVMEIGPDPDGAGALLRPATRTTYDTEGQVTQVERGTATSSAGANFAALATTGYDYDPVGNKTAERTQVGLTQYAYDGLGRVTCTAVRMNPALLTTPPAHACLAGTPGIYGPDRISRNVYDPAGQLVRQVRGEMTSLVEDYATYTYTPNGQRASVKDANGNLSAYAYDGFDRLIKLSFPSTTRGAGAASATDFEAYDYDAAGNRTKLWRRGMATTATPIIFTYDRLNRQTVKNFPDATPDVYTNYDAAGRPLSLLYGNATTGTGVVVGYDTAGRLTSEATFGREMTYQWDTAGNRTKVTWPDAVFVDYVYDVLNRVTQVRENGATAAPGRLAVFAYDDLGRRISLTRGNGNPTTYSYDTADRLTALNQNVSGTAFDQSYTLDYSPASQMVSRVVTNAAYDWARTAGVKNWTHDGLNRDAAIAAVSGGYDLRGNATNDGARVSTFDLENRLLTSTPTGMPTVTLSYDPAGRLNQTAAGVTTQFLYDGDRLVAEYNTAGALLRRYVHGPGVDEPLVWYEGAATDTTTRRWLHQDHQGSIIAWSNGSGQVTASQVFSYGPYGEPGADNWSGPRFRYTGQIAIPETKLYHYKARVYDPAAARFLQTDPVGEKDDLNLYVYVGNDPVNKSDPTGQEAACVSQAKGCPVDTNSVRKDFDNAVKFVGRHPRLTALGFSALPVAKWVKTAITLARSEPKTDKPIERIEWRPRRSEGADGGRSRQGIERNEKGEVISRIHEVKVDDKVVHQHTNSVGKYGGERQFPDEWTGRETINAPYENIPPPN